MARDRKGGTVDLWSGEPTHLIAPNLIRVGQCCPVTILDWQEPTLGLQIPRKFSLQYFFTQKGVAERFPYLVEEFNQVPAWFVRGVCDSLWVAWSRFKSGAAGEPRFKGIADPLTSLTYSDAAKLTLTVAGKNGTISIPKLGLRNGKQVPSKLEVIDLGRRFSSEENGEQHLFPVSVARIVRTPEATWQLHLSSYRISPGDIPGLLVVICSESFSCPLLKLAMLLISPWALKRTQHCTLTVPGEGYTVAIDDRGHGYTLLPRRHTDGAIDPHNLLARLDHRIENLSREISWKYECAKRHGTPSQSKRMKELKQKRRKLMALRACILRSNRQKIAHFLSERSRTITIFHKPTHRIPKPKRLLVEGTNPAQYAPNGAEKVAKANRAVASAAPGEFIALLKREADDRRQPIKIVEMKAKKEPKVRGKKGKSS